MSSTRYESVRTPAAPFSRQHVEFSGLFAQGVRGVFDRVYAWQERAHQRTHIATLDDRLLKDAGISRAAVAEEVAKPFWRA